MILLLILSLFYSWSHCRWKDWCSPKRGWDHSNRFSSATFNTCPKQWLGIPTLYVVTLSMFNEVWWEVIVRFVDIVGSIHNYCLNVISQLQLMAELVSINFNVVISRCFRYNIMWWTLSVTCNRALFCSGYSGFLHNMTELLL